MIEGICFLFPHYYFEKEMDSSMDRLDIKLWKLAAKGQIVPDRSLLKTPEQITAIKRRNQQCGHSTDFTTGLHYKNKHEH